MSEKSGMVLSLITVYQGCLKNTIAMKMIKKEFKNICHLMSVIYLSNDKKE